MAQRTISTKLAISGESEYRAALSRINTELKTLQSALKLTESQYQTNANSMQALQAKGQALNNLYQAQKNKVQELRNALDNAKSAEQKYAQQKADLQKKIEENNKALEKLKTTTGDTTKEEAKLTEENAKLQKELTEVDAKLAAAEKGTNSWQTQLNNAEIQLNNLDAEIQKNDKYMDEASKSADGCATSIDEFGREVDETAESVQGLGQILASQELAQFAEKVKDALVSCAQASMEFENGMAGVKRTTGITGQELDELGNYFKNLSTEIPITTKELTDIATTAGQLGVKGKDNIQQFTEVMAKLATTTDLTADTAATMLAQFANITGIDDYERMGSVVASLGDATATTATKVVEMSQGIAATGTLAGMSATDIMSISAAVGSLGIESAAGSTAMSTLISTLYKATQSGGEKLTQFASVAGMTAGEFKAAWENDAVGALDAFIRGLNDTERNGESAIMILDELGITNVRQTKAILGLASAGDLLTGTIEQGNRAWEENTALNEKAGVMFDTMKAKMQTLENSSTNLKIAIGDALAPAIIGLAEGGQKAIEGITSFVQKHPSLTAALTAVASGIVGITTAVAGAKAAWKAADFLGMTGPLKDIAAAAAGAGGGISGLVTALGTIALPAAAAATALAGIVAVVDEIKTVDSIGFLGEGKTLEEYADNVDKCTAALELAKQEYENLAASGADLTMAQNELDHATIALAHATEEYEAAQESATEATEAAGDAAEGLTEADAHAQAAAEELTMALDEIAKAYKDAYDEARESLEGQIGLFDSYAAEISEDTDTAREMLDVWAQQTANLAAYTENLEKAARYGLDDGLVRSLADGSTESAGYLATIIGEIENCANGTGTLGTSAEEAVAKFNESFKQTEEAKNNLAETMVAINTSLEEGLLQLEEQAAAVNFDGFWDAVDNAFENVGVEFNDIGLNVGSGLKGGIESSTGDVTGAAEQMANDTVDAAKGALGVESPSTVFAEIGSNLDAGLAEGIEKNASTVTGAIQALTSNLKVTMKESGFDAAEHFASGLKEIQAKTEAELQGLKSTLNMGTMGMYDQMFGIGSNVVMGMIQGIYSQSGYLYDAVYSVTSNAISAARSAAAVASPSKKTREIFEYVGEGMAVGIESKRERVATATQGVVDRALSVDTTGVEKAARMLKIQAPDMGSLLYGKYMDPSTKAKEGDINIHIDRVEIGDDQDVGTFADLLGREIQREKRMRGQTS